MEIWDYIADDSEANADRFISTVDAKFVSLAAQPHMGRARPELPRENLRSFPVGRYVILYRLLPDGIEVVRVLHGARDFDTSL